MDVNINDNNLNMAHDLNKPGWLNSATELTPLQLNNIRLDVQHTILTPDYLDNIEKQQNNNPTQS